MNTNIEELKKMAEKYIKMKEKLNENAIKWYRKNYVVTPGISEEERLRIYKNIEERKIRAKEKYLKNPQYFADKSKRHREKKKEQNN